MRISRFADADKERQCGRRPAGDHASWEARILCMPVQPPLSVRVICCDRLLLANSVENPLWSFPEQIDGGTKTLPRVAIVDPGAI